MAKSSSNKQLEATISVNKLLNTIIVLLVTGLLGISSWALLEVIYLKVGLASLETKVTNIETDIQDVGKDIDTLSTNFQSYLFLQTELSLQDEEW